MTCDRCPFLDVKSYASHGHVTPVCRHPNVQPPIAAVLVLREQCKGEWNK